MWGMHLALISRKLIARVGAVEGQQLIREEKGHEFLRRCGGWSDYRPVISA
jgi:hypothetical protein